MRIVIDMQGAQTESRFRGIGRYTMAFAQAVVLNAGEHEIILALSGLFPETIEPIRAAFEGVLPQEKIRVWYAPGPVKEGSPDNESRRGVAELLREAFLASLQPDVIHISSLFEGYVDDAVTSIGRFDTTTPVSITLYDLIPLLNPGQYLKPNPQYKLYYSRKVEYLQRATLCLAISDFCREESIAALPELGDKTVNVSTAVSDCFELRPVSEEAINRLQCEYGIKRSFVLYTGGADERKNLPRLIAAYAALRSDIRESHQLLFAGRMPEGEIQILKREAKSVGLGSEELCFTGYISDEDLIQLYNLCELYVFPSWHEGFGLPALEALACGALVIGANASSLPEVIGLEEALFDPLDIEAITSKMMQALENDAFRARLREHGILQANMFSWDTTAQRAIMAWESLLNRKVPQAEYFTQSLGPDRLLKAIASHIDHTDEPNIVALSHCIAQNESSGIERQILVDVSELCQKDAATGVQRVVRSYLNWLLKSPPVGFRIEPVYATQSEGYRYARQFTQRFLGCNGALAGDGPVRWQRGDLFFGLDMQHHVQLAHKNFYRQLAQDGVVVKFLVYDLLPIQLADLFKDSNAKELHEQWLAMVVATDGAICISKSTADALDTWIAENAIPYATAFRSSWVHIGADIEGSQPSHGLPDDATLLLQKLNQRPTFLCVSTVEPRKGQQQILEAIELLWECGTDINLVFVGQQGWKVETFADKLQDHPELDTRLFWLQGISDEYLNKVYKVSTCLIAASVDEGFGLSLIEAASHGIPIVARDIPVFREVAGEHAEYFQGKSGEELAEALKKWLLKFDAGKHTSSREMPWSTWQQSTEKLKTALVKQNYPRRQLMVDISELVQRDAKSGIQRVVRNILREWLANPPVGWRIEPVYATVNDGYRYAREFSSSLYKGSRTWAVNDRIETSPGDVFLGLDLAPGVVPCHSLFYRLLRDQGVQVKFVMYDLQPLTPDYFEEVFEKAFLRWLWVAVESDEIICISKAVANEVRDWLKGHDLQRLQNQKISYFHLGADIIEASEEMIVAPDQGLAVIDKMSAVPSFLMVSTLAPHKGHSQVLSAMELLWSKGVDVNLILVGKNGWCIDQLVEKIKEHPELDQRLFWLNDISNTLLESLYREATCLIAASYTEGFGLPLIEAAQYRLPIIARNIPVFHEVAGEHAYYFDSKDPVDLANVIRNWIELYENDEHPVSDNMPWLTWRESAQQLLNLAIRDNDLIKETKKEAL